MKKISKGNYGIKINEDLWTVHKYQICPTEWAINGPDFLQVEIKTKKEAVSILQWAAEDYYDDLLGKVQRVVSEEN